MSMRPSFARESRSQYARSASFDDNRSIQQRSSSCSVVERELSYPSLVWDYLDDPFLFPRRARFLCDDIGRRIRWRLYDDFVEREFFKPPPLEFERNLSVTYRDFNDSVSTTARSVPVQRSPSSSSIYREKGDRNNEYSSNAVQRQEESYKVQVPNRFATDEWSYKHEPPTRKRTSITIFVRQPHIQYSDPPNFQRTTSIRDYGSNRRNFF